MPGAKSSLPVFANVAASQTDQVLVAGAPGRRVRVLAFFINHGATDASAVTFNSKGSGAGTAISPLIETSPSGGLVAPSSDGWFQTLSGEALTVTTGLGSTTGIMVIYEKVG